jgi:hypothetical protein
MSDLEERLRAALREVADAGPDAPVELPLAPPRHRRPTRLIAIVSAGAAAAAAVVAIAVVAPHADRSSGPSASRGLNPLLSAHPSPDPSESSTVLITGSPSDSLRVVAGTAAEFAADCPTGAEYGLTFSRDSHLSGSTPPIWDVAQAAYLDAPEPPTSGAVRVGRLDVRLRTLADLKGQSVSDLVWVVQWPLADVASTASGEPVPLSRTVVLSETLKPLASYLCYQYGMNGARGPGVNVPPLSTGDTFDPGMNSEWIVSDEKPALTEVEAVASARKDDGGAPAGAPRAQLVRYTNWVMGREGSPLSHTNRLVWLLRWDGVTIPDLGPPVPSGQPQRSFAPGTETIPIDARTGRVVAGTFLGGGGHVYHG